MQLVNFIPRAQTACSQTFLSEEESNEIKWGTAPAFTTDFVCSEVPEAILVSAQADSNWRSGSWSLCKNSTIRGMTPEFIKVSIGGFLSLDNIFLAAYNSCIRNLVWLKQRYTLLFGGTFHRSVYP